MASSDPQPPQPAAAAAATTAATVTAVGVRATFSVSRPGAGGEGAAAGRAPREQTHVFECMTPLEALPPRATAAPQDWPPYAAGSSAYSGRHDGGLLPPLQEGGAYGAMVDAVLAARKDGDRHMTGVIRAEGGAVKSEAGEDVEGQEDGEEMDEEEEDEEEQEEENGEQQAAEVKDGKVLVGAGAGGERRGRGVKKPKI